MPSTVSAKTIAALFIALAMSSLALKAAAGTPRYTMYDGTSDLVDRQIVQLLDAQGFRTSIRPRELQSSIIDAARGNCRLIVRDGRAAADSAAVFSRDARGVGPVRYLYKNASYDSPPTILVRFGFFEANLLYRGGMDPTVHALIAIAQSDACGRSNFGLEDVRIAH
jgi:hypothetical protein